MKISIIGLGFVGSAIENSLLLKDFKINETLFIYDKYKNGGIGSLQNCLSSDIMFLCLPTLFDKELNKYDKTSIYEICNLLQGYNYTGLIIIKSTVEPETTETLCKDFKTLKFIHNPEFLTARTANEDFHNQNHVVLGKSNKLSEEDIKPIVNFYTKYYPNAKISLCTSMESESMKIYCNTFYSVKVQFFTELYLLCQKNNTNYNVIRDLMLSNNWINPMHTNIPGPDGQVSYGGVCFPKDANALNHYMKSLNSPNGVLDASIKERNLLRKNE